jgi:hypothetical protein
MSSTVIPELVQPGMRLGRHRNHMPQSRLFALRADPTVELHDVDHELHVPVLNQGDVGACVLFTQVENLSAAGYWETLTPGEQSRLTPDTALDWYAETTAADPYPGAWLRGGGAGSEDTGTDAESAAKVVRGHGFAAGWLHAFSPLTALQALMRAPVQIGIDWRTGCDRPDRDGIIHWTGAIRGGHEVLSHRYDATRKLVGIRNHWGPGWGLDGEAWMPVLEWQAALQAGGDALQLVAKDQPAPKPAADPELTALEAAMRPWATNPHRWSAATKASQVWRDYLTKHGL